MPTILLINDDGIKSQGLVALKRRLMRMGEVIVVAPMDERSGIGKALTAYGSIRILETTLMDGSKAYATTGTPADSFLLAVNKVLKRLPDLLVAGINLGPNLGIDDLLNSGTLGAALEAAAHGVPAIAVSYCIEKIEDRKVWKASITLEELKTSATFAEKAVRYVLENGMPLDVDIVSINVPQNADPTKVEITSLSYKGYGDIHAEREDGYRIESWELATYPDGAPGTDVHAVTKRRTISVTPIKLRLPHEKKALEEMAKFLTA